MQAKTSGLSTLLNMVAAGYGTTLIPGLRVARGGGSVGEVIAARLRAVAEAGAAGTV